MFWCQVEGCARAVRSTPIAYARVTGAQRQATAGWGVGVLGESGRRRSACACGLSVG